MIRYEIFSRIKGTLIWALSFVFMIVTGMNKFMTLAEQGDDQMSALLNSFPRVIRVVYGMEGYNLSNSIGYSALMLFFILIMVAFHGINLGNSLLGRDMQEKTVDFLFVKPWSRGKILFHKVLAALFLVLVMQGVIGISFYSQMKGLEAMSIFWKMMTSCIATHLLFLSMGVCLSVLFPRREQAQRTSLSITLLSYILVVMGQLYEIEKLEKASPLGFFPKALEETNFYAGLSVTLVLSLIFLLVSVVAIKKKPLMV